MILPHRCAYPDFKYAIRNPLVHIAELHINTTGFKALYLMCLNKIGGVGE